LQKSVITSLTTAHLHAVQSIVILDEVATITRAVDIAIVNTISFVGDHMPPDHSQVHVQHRSGESFSALNVLVFLLFAV
jgi:hypothetical protein